MASSSKVEVFDEFYKDLKETEHKDSVLTPKQQIDRLLRPGSTYRNLNPYDVLQVDPDLPYEDVKKKFRRLSILVHPDKNQGDLDRAQAAFDAVKKAYSLLEDKETRQRCYEIVEEARGRTRKNMEEKRKKAQRDAKLKGLNPDEVKIEEDDPLKFLNAVSILTMKLFADLELKRRQNENKISEDAKKKREHELETQEKREKEEEFIKNWEESRQGRVNSWLNFKSGGKIVPPPQIAAPKRPAPSATLGASQYTAWLESGNAVTTTNSNKPQSSQVQEPAEKKKKKQKFSPLGFRPPKHKPESR